MKELRSQIEIEAPAERVWQVLTDFAAYPDWNPFIRRVNGRPEVEEQLVVRMRPSGTRGMTFRPTVMKVEPNRQLRWLGHLLVPGLFDGEHIFEIQELDPDRVFSFRGRSSKVCLSPCSPAVWTGTPREASRR